MNRQLLCLLYREPSTNVIDILLRVKADCCCLLTVIIETFSKVSSSHGTQQQCRHSAVSGLPQCCLRPDCAAGLRLFADPQSVAGVGMEMGLLGQIWCGRLPQPQENNRSPGQ